MKLRDIYLNMLNLHVILFSRKRQTDVLDHSCSVMAFGGKVGIDGTRKMKEEEGNSQFTIHNSQFEKSQILNLKSQILNLFTEIKGINSSLLEKGISLVFVSVEKNRKNHISELNEKLFAHEAFKQVKVIIYLDHTLDINDIADAVWRFANNVDPKRDHFIVQPKSSDECSHIGFDGTRKTKEFDDFDREWPNILASDEATIKHIDEIWDKLGLGKFIPSPSLKYRKQLYAGGAVAEG